MPANRTQPRTVLLHSVWDAEDAVARGLLTGARVLWTHPSVAVRLSERHGIASEPLSGHLAACEVRDRLQRSYGESEAILSALDARLGAGLREATGTGFDWFRTLYASQGAYAWHVYRCLALALERELAAEPDRELTVYQWSFARYTVAGPTTMREFLAVALAGARADVVEPLGPAGPSGSEAALVRLRRLSKLGRTMRVARERAAARSRARAGQGRAGGMLLLEPLIDAGFLRDELPGLPLLYWADPSCAAPPVGASAAVWSGEVPRLPAAPDPADLEPLDAGLRELGGLMVRDLLADLAGVLPAALDALATVDALVEAAPPAVAVWANSPASGAKALAVARLMERGVPVVGVQHGILYGEVRNLQRELDYDRCDHFVSYGFDARVLERLFPERPPVCELHPFGRTDAPAGSRPRRPVDVLLPITNSCGMLEEGLIRIPPEDLLERQTAILEWLSRSGLDVVVKPIAFSNDRNLAPLPLIRRLPGLRYVDDVSLTGFLAGNAPRAAVIEYPSQPLADLVAEDVEIFMFEDPVLPWTHEAREMLAARVWLVADVAELARLLGEWRAGRLEPKRDGAYERAYVRRPGAREATVGLLRGLASAGGERG